MAYNSLLKYIVEFVGTFVFLSVIINTTNPSFFPAGNYNAPFAIVTALLAVIFMAGGISGGHFNPAVTLMFSAQNIVDTITGKVAFQFSNYVDPIFYIVAQIGGAYAAFVFNNIVVASK